MRKLMIVVALVVMLVPLFAAFCLLLVGSVTAALAQAPSYRAGSLVIEAEKVGADSLLSQIVSMVAQAQQEMGERSSGRPCSIARTSSRNVMSPSPRTIPPTPRSGCVHSSGARVGS